MTKRKRRIGILGFDGAEALDLNGPFDVFATASRFAAEAPYEPMVLGINADSFTAESGLRMHAHVRLDQSPPLDTVIIPGGSVLHSPGGCDLIVQWLGKNAAKTRRVVSVCTGIYALASAGLLDGRRATTHWRYADDVARRWPKINVNPDAIFVKDGRFYTSAGITAGIDLALALIEEDLGSKLALAVARELVVYLKRSGGQLQYSEPLRFQSHSTGAFGDITTWMRDHLDDLSIEELAAQTHLSVRHFNRKFKAAFGATPGAFIEDLRLDEARWRLTDDDSPIESVAASVGYQSDDAFRRAFQRRFGIGPRDYRAGFLVTNTTRPPRRRTDEAS